jgi:sigma-B regulation protein RsbU (phosphoserine phosphatase)
LGKNPAKQTEESPMELAQKKILIVDDEPTMRMLMKGLFEDDKDLRLSFAEDGLQAIAHVEREKPDLVLLDIMMPGADGFEVCRRIRKLYERDVVVFMFTGLAGAKYEEEARQAGADLYLNKPLNLKMLYQVVKEKI